MTITRITPLKAPPIPALRTSLLTKKGEMDAGQKFTITKMITSEELPELPDPLKRADRTAFTQIFLDSMQPVQEGAEQVDSTLLAQMVVHSSADLGPIASEEEGKQTRDNLARVIRGLHEYAMHHPKANSDTGTGQPPTPTPTPDPDPAPGHARDTVKAMRGKFEKPAAATTTPGGGDAAPPRSDAKPSGHVKAMQAALKQQGLFPSEPQAAGSQDAGPHAAGPHAAGPQVLDNSSDDEDGFGLEAARKPDATEGSEGSGGSEGSRGSRGSRTEPSLGPDTPDKPKKEKSPPIPDKPDSATGRGKGTGGKEGAGGTGGKEGAGGAGGGRGSPTSTGLKRTPSSISVSDVRKEENRILEHLDDIQDKKGKKDFLKASINYLIVKHEYATPIEARNEAPSIARLKVKYAQIRKEANSGKIKTDLSTAEKTAPITRQSLRKAVEAIQNGPKTLPFRFSTEEESKTKGWVPRQHATQVDIARPKNHLDCAAKMKAFRKELEKIPELELDMTVFDLPGFGRPINYLSRIGEENPYSSKKSHSFNVFEALKAQTSTILELRDAVGPIKGDKVTDTALLLAKKHKEDFDAKKLGSLRISYREDLSRRVAQAETNLKLYERDYSTVILQIERGRLVTTLTSKSIKDTTLRKGLVEALSEKLENEKGDVNPEFLPLYTANLKAQLDGCDTTLLTLTKAFAKDHAELEKTKNWKKDIKSAMKDEYKTLELARKALGEIKDFNPEGVPNKEVSQRYKDIYSKAVPDKAPPPQK